MHLVLCSVYSSGLFVITLYKLIWYTVQDLFIEGGFESTATLHT